MKRDSVVRVLMCGLLLVAGASLAQVRGWPPYFPHGKSVVMTPLAVEQAEATASWPSEEQQAFTNLVRYYAFSKIPTVVRDNFQADSIQLYEPAIRFDSKGDSAETKNLVEFAVERQWMPNVEPPWACRAPSTSYKTLISCEVDGFIDNADSSNTDGNDRIGIEWGSASFKNFDANANETGVIRLEKYLKPAVYAGQNREESFRFYCSNGTLSSQTRYISTFTVYNDAGDIGDILGIMVDPSVGKAYAYVRGVVRDTIDYSAHAPVENSSATVLVGLFAYAGTHTGGVNIHAGWAGMRVVSLNVNEIPLVLYAE
jgi:hypothetical protein